jgi:glucosamine--fructose-6-phosphate aminotransferase (isomerizing)
MAAVGSLQEIKAHHGPIVTVTPGWSEEIEALADHSVTLPECAPEVSTIVMAVALQLLAYHTALWLGRDIDQSRNLAKIVTVE